jgi:3-hydroxymyristoyl/3-hydroxydecanoyl-(acyl carrier protein) dehydratase
MYNISFVIDADHPCLEGHFPDNPIVPGVLLLDEMMNALENEVMGLRLQGIRQVKFLQPVLPDQCVGVELLEVAGALRFKAYHDGKLVFNGEVIAS